MEQGALADTLDDSLFLSVGLMLSLVNIFCTFYKKKSGILLFSAANQKMLVIESDRTSLIVILIYLNFL